jgi:hypothetical protein
MLILAVLLIYSNTEAQNKSPKKFFGRNTFGEAWVFIGNASDKSVDINFYGITGAIRQTSDQQIKKLFGIEASASKYKFKGIDSLKFSGSGEGKDFSVGPTWERWRSTSNRLNSTRFSGGGIFSSRKSNQKIYSQNTYSEQQDVEQDTRLYARFRSDMHKDQMHFSRITIDAFYELQIQANGEKSVNGVKSVYKPVDRSNFGLGLEVGVLSFSEIFGKNTAITFSLGGKYHRYIHKEETGEVKAIASFYNFWSDIVRIVYGRTFNLKTSDGKPVETISGAVDALNLIKGFFD